ncbi:hypothetical protein EUGRSUZ_I02202 [Eucalyptus grandis]|uniref:Uncharacterized protein n=2 Tax=Eucalyptus grandis TaxID=71139 RepID=A0ACC3JHC8_EUCGR|nr:hypothetical protein EUGRSUZ_I02202 [Eucalyptus grandis]
MVEFKISLYARIIHGDMFKAQMNSFSLKEEMLQVGFDKILDGCYVWYEISKEAPQQEKKNTLEPLVSIMRCDQT